MPHSRSLLPISVRPAAMWSGFAFLLTAGALCGDHRVAAEPFPRDPVAEFRQALLQEKDSIRDKEALRFRRENLTRKAQALTSLGEMSRVLLLQDWRVEGSADPVADIDREVRDSIADRFINGLKEVIASGDPSRCEAAAELISETASSTRAPGSGVKANFLRERLAKLAPELARLAEAPDSKVKQFAARGLGNVQGDPKLTIHTLEGLMKSGDPATRRAAADALGNVVQVVSKQERLVQGGSVGRSELRKEFLTTGSFVVPASEVGLASNQPVEVRRLSADALQQLSSSLVDLTQDPFPAEQFPPPGRPWSTDDAKHVSEAREKVNTEREELQPLLDTFAKESAGLSAASSDPDPYVRIQVRKVLEDLAITRHRMKRAEASVPQGEGVPSPRPEPKPGDKKDQAPKTGGAFLPSGVTPSGVPILLVAEEKENQGTDKPNADPLGTELRSTLPAVIAGLKDPNVRARIGAVEVLETMGPEAAPAIPALVGSLSDSDRFVRWAAVRTLGRLAPRSPELVVPASARLLNDEDLDVEIAAANTIERYGPIAKTAVATLGLRASRGDSDIRIAAMKALEAIGTDAAPALPSVTLNLIPKSRAQREQEPGPEAGPVPPARTRVAAAETLGRFGKLAEQAVPVLQQSLNDTDADVRRAASEAILKITAK
jgi:HEAT repeat protein